MFAPDALRQTKCFSFNQKQIKNVYEIALLGLHRYRVVNKRWETHTTWILIYFGNGSELMSENCLNESSLRWIRDHLAANSQFVHRTACLPLRKVHSNCQGNYPEREDKHLGFVRAKFSGSGPPPKELESFLNPFLADTFRIGGERVGELVYKRRNCQQEVHGRGLSTHSRKHNSSPCQTRRNSVTGKLISLQGCGSICMIFPNWIMNGTEARLKPRFGAVSIAERRSVCKINMFDIKSRQLFVDGGVNPAENRSVCQF